MKIYAIVSASACPWPDPGLQFFTDLDKALKAFEDNADDLGGDDPATARLVEFDTDTGNEMELRSVSYDSDGCVTMDEDDEDEDGVFGVGDDTNDCLA